MFTSNPPADATHDRLAEPSQDAGRTPGPPVRPPVRPRARSADGRLTGAVLGVARWSARHPWRAIAAWIAFVVISLAVGSLAGTRQLSNADSGVGQSAAADRAIEAARFPSTVTENVLVQSRSGPLDPAVSRSVVAEVSRRYGALPEVKSIGAAVTAADDRSVVVPVIMNVAGSTGSDAVSYAGDHVAALETLARSLQAEHPGLAIGEVGDASLQASVNRQVGSDFHRATVLSLPLTLIILLIAFGALFAAGVPVLLALTAVASALGLSGLVSHLVPASDTLGSVVLLIGMAVGVDYSLFYLRRAREERVAGASTIDAVERAAATSGRAVLVSGIAVMIAMSGMFLAGDAVFSSLAVGTILVVAVAVLGSMTALPAVLAKLGDRIDRPRVPFVRRLQRPEAPRFWPAVMRVLLAKPAVALVLGVVALLALAAPALSMQLRSTGPQDLPRSIPELRTYDRLVAAFPQEGTAHTLVIWSATPLVRGTVERAVGSVESGAAASGLFVRTSPPVEFSPDGRTAKVDLAVPYGTGDPRAVRSLDLLRDHLVPGAFASLRGVSTGVTGDVASDADFSATLRSRLPWVFGFVVLLTFVVMVLAFQSVVIAGTAVVLNLLSVAAAYGLLVLVFQHRWAEGLLGFHSSGAVISWLPLFLFVVLFGLSMDYHVFVVSRIREAAASGLSTREAVTSGVVSSAGAVTSAAIVMVGVFAIFATLSLLEFKQVGIGLAAAVLLDATVVRAVLLPAAMVLLGRYNWWMPGSKRQAPTSPTLGRSTVHANAG
jgi:putative drug exporter of the RND superfamily